MDTNIYYHCRCYIHNDVYVICQECKTWMDYVDGVIDLHKADKIKPIVHSKRWKNKHKQKKLCTH